VLDLVRRHAGPAPVITEQKLLDAIVSVINRYNRFDLIQWWGSGKRAAADGTPLVVAERVNGTTRALGWDTPSSPSQSGKYFSPRSVGHLGYTGTSLWIDPVRQLSIVLLTNRTWPDCSNWAIKQVRPRFHDAVFEALHLE